MSRLVPVWDVCVRLGHWLLAGAVILAYVTQEGPAKVHDRAGYVALAIVAFRLIWGFVGSRHARFHDFVFGIRDTAAYARQVVAGKEPHYLGHNPLGGWMVLALLFCVGGAGVTGWLYTTDHFWGDELVETIHSVFGHLVVILAALHVAGVIFTSFRQRENLVAAMVHGKKRAPD